MDDFIHRLITEKEELVDKQVKLTQFINTDKFKELDSFQQALLEEQEYFMLNYIRVLSKRIISLTKV